MSQVWNRKHKPLLALGILFWGFGCLHASIVSESIRLGETTEQGQKFDMHS